MKTIISLLTAVALIATGCKTSSDSKASANTVSINLEPKSGSNVAGTAEFKEADGKVTLMAKLKNLTPGIHAIHIHEKADCSASDATSAGGHWNPAFKKHGKWGDAEYHRGDIGNFTADIDGNATVLFSTDEWCIGCADQSKNIIGKGLIVHAKADDYVTQPTGDAGGRMACAGIIK